MKKFNSIFKVSKPIVGMIHLEALPGTPNHKGDIEKVTDKALEELKIYLNAGIDAVAIENMHDVPYIKNEVGHEISTAMSIIGREIKKETNKPCGIQVLSSANKAALAAAHTAGLEFIRAEGFVYGHLADEGYIDSCAGELLRYRKMIGADNVSVFTDIKKKHSAHTITSDISIVETAKTAEYFLSDGLIVTGTSTGEETDIREVNSVKENTSLPVIVGSGVTLDNLQKYMSVADGLIIGSWFKENGFWSNKIDPERVVRFMDKVNNLRNINQP